MYKKRVKLVGATVVFTSDITPDNFDGLLDRVSDLFPIFRAFDVYYKDKVQEAFTSEGRDESWPALANSTVRERVRLGYGGRHPILERSGDLRGGFTSSSGRTFYAMGNYLPYFKYHQQDTQHSDRLPRRAMIVFMEQDREQLRKLLKEHLNGNSG